ncbi:MAG: M48 family metallopeptidase [Actinomycetota bacterium]
MTRKIWLRALPLAMGLGLLVPAAGPVAAQSQDIGRQMETEYGVVGRNSREGREYNDMLDRTVERIVRGVNAQKRDRNFQLKSATILGGRDQKHDAVVNAFALPDGRIYVTLGLLRMLEASSMPEDELAFVVGHEVTHVAERHSVGQQRKALPYYLGAILLGQVTDSALANQAIGLGVQAKTSSFSRQDEYAADKGGLLAMRSAGYDLRAAAAMLRRLKGPGEQNKFMNGVFGSHPISENRIQRVKNMTSDLESGRAIRRDDKKGKR